MQTYMNVYIIICNQKTVFLDGRFYSRYKTPHQEHLSRLFYGEKIVLEQDR